MEAIFHEKQEGSLCAQHCLNALLQGEYFTAVDLASLGQNLDDTERQHMAEAGLHSEEYRRFLEQPSVNMDDSGYFSVQVIASALKVWGLELITYSGQNPIAIVAKINPLTQTAFICNYKDHWFTVRKLGNQWFNLNSLLTGPELISNLYLTMFLAQLQQEGYCIFVVVGDLPECEADNLLKLVSIEQTDKPMLLAEVRSKQRNSPLSASTSSRSPQPVADEQDIIEEEQLQEALRRSLQDESPSTSQLQSAVSLSAVLSSQSSEPKNDDEVRQKRVHYFQSLTEKQIISVTTSGTSSSSVERVLTQSCTESNDDAKPTDEHMTEDEMLEAAIKMSMDSPES